MVNMAWVLQIVLLYVNMTYLVAVKMDEPKGPH